jgi:hypothetical protein
MMAATRRTKRTGSTMPPEVKAAYKEIDGGVRRLAKSIAEIEHAVRKAERKIEADAHARIRTLRQEAKAQLNSLQARRREVSRTLKSLAVVAEGSWREVKESADSILAEARATAASVIERFRNALGA